MLHVPWEKGDFSTLWRLCIESPSQPKLASSLHNKRLSYWRLTGCGRNDGNGGLFYNLRPKGATITLGPKGRRPLSEAMHSEHILKERSDAQNVVSRFPCGDITRRRQAATTFGPEGRQPSPLNSLNLMNPLNPHTEGVSTGARQHRHLERRCMSV